MVKRLMKRFPSALKIVCVAFCLILVISMLVLPSFAAENVVPPQSINNISPRNYYFYLGNAELGDSLYYITFSDVYATYIYVDITTGISETINYVDRIYFSNTAVTLRVNGLDVDVPIDNVLIALDFEGFIENDVSQFTSCLFTPSLYTFNDMVNEYLEGQSYGESIGEEKGYQDGLIDGSSNTWSSLGQFLITTVGAFTNAELFYGFTIGGLLSILVGASLFYWFIKLLR